jgi:hypothetical protein
MFYVLVARPDTFSQIQLTFIHNKQADDEDKDPIVSMYLTMEGKADKVVGSP